MIKPITPQDFDHVMVEAGEDVHHHLRPAGTRPITLDLPVWVIEELETSAARMKVSRDDLIKVWLAEKLMPKHH